jgi:uncharacterized protein
MELRGTVLNVVDFGAFIDVGLSDSGLVHISQLSAGYVRDPHDVVAVGDQVRVWVTAIDNERRRVALTMIAPGTERPRPTKSRGPRRRHAAARSETQQPADGAPPAAEQRGRSRRAAKPRGDRRDRRSAHRPPRTGAYEKRAAKKLVPITKAMEEGKEFMRSFGDLLQYHQKKKEQDQSGHQSESSGSANGSAQSERQADKEKQGDKGTGIQGD